MLRLSTALAVVVLAACDLNSFRRTPMNDPDTFAPALGIASNRGEFVQSVQPGEPAEVAGLQAGDVVLRVDGKEVTPDQTLSFIVANIPPGPPHRPRDHP